MHRAGVNNRFAFCRGRSHISPCIPIAAIREKYRCGKDLQIVDGLCFEAAPGTHVIIPQRLINQS
jgi:hypothetical protein